MSWTGRFAVAGLLLVFFFALGLEPFLGPLLYTLTPLQREYLLAYVASSWHENDSAAATEIRWVLKVEPRKPEPKAKKDRNARPEAKLDLALAVERDLVAKPLTDRVWSGDSLPFTLSEEALREGWTGLTWGYPRQVKSSELAALLRDDYFGGRSWESFFVQPAVALVSLFFLVLIGRAGLQAWQDRRLWGMPLTRRDYLWRWMFEPPKPKVIQAPERVLKGPEKVLKGPEKPAPLTLPAPSPAAPAPLKATATPEVPVARATPPKQAVTVQSVPPVSPVVPEKPKPSFLWDETAGID